MKDELMIDENSVFQFAENIYFESFDDGGLILDSTPLRFIEINNTASDVLKEIDGKQNLHGIVKILSDTYAIPMETALDDVRELFQSLFAQGIIEKK